MPKKPIGDFASVGEAKAYCESLLQRGCEPLTDEEHRRVSLLMKRHPDYTKDWQLCHHTVFKRAILFTLRFRGREALAYQLSQVLHGRANVQ